MIDNNERVSFFFIESNLGGWVSPLSNERGKVSEVEVCEGGVSE